MIPLVICGKLPESPLFPAVTFASPLSPPNDAVVPSVPGGDVPFELPRCAGVLQEEKFSSPSALLALFWSIEQGLLGLPEMQIAGNGSDASVLRWYQDRAGSEPPQAWFVSVPLLVYRLAMLAWALWLAQALLSWLRWGWDCLRSGGLWRSLRRSASSAG